MDTVTVEMWEGLRAFHIYTVRRGVLLKGKKFNLLTPEGVNFIWFFRLKHTFDPKRMDTQPHIDENMMPSFLIGGEACPQVFCIMDSVLLATPT